MTAIEQPELWLVYQENWKHKLSVTISVKQSEWLHVGAWVTITLTLSVGLASCLSQTMYTPKRRIRTVPRKSTNALHLMPAKINWAELAAYEQEDNTVSSQTLACTDFV